MFDIIGQLRTFCTVKGWRFIYGNDQYANAELTYRDMGPNDIVMIADLNVSPLFGPGGGIQGVNYSGGIMLGRKREQDTYDLETDPIPDITESSLDETMEQKYDRRLKDLMTILFSGLAEFSCENDYDITQLNGRVDINRFDENLDFVAATVTFSSI